MQKKSLFKGLLTTAFAAAMAVMVAVPAKAAPAAPALSLKNTITSDKHVTGYTFSTPQVSNGNKIYFNVYKTDPKASLTGSYITGTITKNDCKKVCYWKYYDKNLDRSYYLVSNENSDYYGQYSYWDVISHEQVYTITPTGQPIVDYVYTYYDSKVKDERTIYYYYDVEYELYGYSDPETGVYKYTNAPQGVPQYAYVTEETITPIAYDYFSGSYALEKGSEYTLDASDFAPGTYQVTATYFDSTGYAAAWRAYKAVDVKSKKPGDATVYAPNIQDYYSVASAPVTITITGGVSIDTCVTATSVQLDMKEDSAASGYEIYRKAGKKFVKIATTSKATYTDKGLTSKTKYTYKIRPFYVNSRTGEKTMGAETQVSATTNGSALNLKVQLKGKKNVVLTWTKVKSAKKYEIYRSTGKSDSTVTKKGQGNGFEGYELIKTVKKSKKKFIDKKAIAGETYDYKVRAVVSNSEKKKDSKKKDKVLDVEESVNISLKFDSLNIYALGDPYIKADGSKVVQWSRVAGATGYSVEKYNNETGNWDVFTTLGKKATSVALPAAKVTPYTVSTYYSGDKEYANTGYSTSDQYRIRAVKGNTYSNAIGVTVEAQLASVNSVTATKVANGIQVSWDPVQNASYYKVYRVKAGSLKENKDAGYVSPKYLDVSPEYLEQNGEPVTNYVNVAPLAAPIDVVAYNNNIKTKQAAKEDCVEKHLTTLTEGKTYYYQNYSYATDRITATSVLDYAGAVVTSYTKEVYSSKVDETTGLKTEIKACAQPQEVTNLEARYVGPENGVSYQYYVVAYQANVYTVDSYFAEHPDLDRNANVTRVTKALQNGALAYSVNPNSCEATQIEMPQYGVSADIEENKLSVNDSIFATSVGVKKVNTVTYTNSAAPSGKAKLKAVKSPKKKTVSISFKKVAGATSYNIYRSTKKKGKYTCVANVTKTKYKDKTVKSGKKYYYKVVAVNANEAGADIEGKASKVKAVKAK